MDLRVRDKRTGVIRTVTHFAYAAMGPKVYEKLGDEPAQQSPQVHRVVSGPVIKPQITGEKSQEEADQQRAEDVPSETPKKRPGRPAREKSISSNSVADEK